MEKKYLKYFVIFMVGVLALGIASGAAYKVSVPAASGGSGGAGGAGGAGGGPAKNLTNTTNGTTGNNLDLGGPGGDKPDNRGDGLDGGVAKDTKEGNVWMWVIIVIVILATGIFMVLKKKKR